jgi:hypothetical protein
VDQDEEDQGVTPAAAEKDSMRMLFISALLYPYRDVSTVVDGKTISATAWISRFRVKMRVRDLKYISKAHYCVRRISKSVESIDTILTDESQDSEISTMGIMIKDIGAIKAIGGRWPSIFLFALAVDLLPRYEQLKQGILGK